MHNQIKVELIRLKKSLFFYLTIVAFVVFGIMYSYAIHAKGIIMTFSDAVISNISDTSLIFTITLFVSYFIGNEITHRTIDNEIRVGYSRKSVILSRAIVVIPASIIPYLAYIITNAVFLGALNGISPIYYEGIAISDMLIRFIVFLLQLAAIQSISFFIMFASKKGSLGMMLNIGFSFVTCNLLRNWLEHGEFFFKYTSFYRIMLNDGQMVAQDIWLSVISAIANIALMLSLSYLVFRKAELK